MWIPDVVKRELNSAQGNVHFVISPNCRPFVRSLVLSNVLYSKPPEKGGESKVNVDKASETKASQEQQKPVLQIAVPDTKEQEIKTADAKIVLDNIKEQSLGKETTATDTLKQIKEKIFDRKPKEVEQEKGKVVYLFSSYFKNIWNRQLWWTNDDQNQR